jgi:hypothetical protein
MGYNYHHAFHPSAMPKITRQQLEELLVSAAFAFQTEFPDATQLDVQVLMETKHVEVQMGNDIRLYSWKQLGLII